MNPYLQFTAGFAKLLAEGRKLPMGALTPLPPPALAPDAPRALIFSPHPAAAAPARVEDAGHQCRGHSGQQQSTPAGAMEGTNSLLRPHRLRPGANAPQRPGRDYFEEPRGKPGAMGAIGRPHRGNSR